MEQQFFKENWEARLNALLNWSEIPEKSAYICSPLRAEKAEHAGSPGIYAVRI